MELNSGAGEHGTQPESLIGAWCPPLLLEAESCWLAPQRSHPFTQSRQVQKVDLNPTQLLPGKAMIERFPAMSRLHCFTKAAFMCSMAIDAPLLALCRRPARQIGLAAS